MMPKFDPIGLLEGVGGMRQSSELMGQNIMQGMLQQENLAGMRQQREQQRTEFQVAQDRYQTIKAFDQAVDALSAGGEVTPEVMEMAAQQVGLPMAERAKIFPAYMEYLQMTDPEKAELDKQLTRSKIGAQDALAGQRRAGGVENMAQAAKAMREPPTKTGATGTWKPVKGTKWYYNDKSLEFKKGEAGVPVGGAGSKLSTHDFLAVVNWFKGKERSWTDKLLDGMIADMADEKGWNIDEQGKTDPKTDAQIDKIMKELLNRMGQQMDLENFSTGIPGVDHMGGAGSGKLVFDPETGGYVRQ